MGTSVSEMGWRTEAARDAAELALERIRLALRESERARRQAEDGQAIAEAAEMLATAAQHAAEEARDAAELTRDSADEARSEAELASGAAQRGNENLRTFLAMAAHDLQGQLTGVLGYAQLLQRRDVSPAMHSKAARRVEHLSAQMSRLVQDINDAGRLGNGGFPLRLAPTDLGALVREVAESLAGTTTRHTILVTGEDGLIGLWDPERLTQVLTNVIGNAIRYSPHGGEIEVGTRLDGDEASITVTDHGIGFRADEVGLLFQPFSRLPDGAKMDGSGLGLSISHGLVTAHGGRISAECQGPGMGTTFTIVLPVAGPPAPGRRDATSPG